VKEKLNGLREEEEEIALLWENENGLREKGKVMEVEPYDLDEQGSGENFVEEKEEKRKK